MPTPSSNLPASYRIGAIGFSYPDWRGTFYPSDLRAGDFLHAYATAFDTLELDTTFHALPSPDRVEKWAQAVPDGFIFAVKTPRLITHDAPLSAATPAMLDFLQALQPLRDAGKLGPILIQFPPYLTQASHALLSRFLEGLPPDFRYAVELRHRSWLHASTAELLAARRIAWVAADYWTQPWSLRVTTDFVYLRFVGKHHQFEYDDREYIDATPRLQFWLAQLQTALQGASPATALPIYAVFANDFAGHAPATANRFRQLVGLPPVTVHVPHAAVQPSLF